MSATTGSLTTGTAGPLEVRVASIARPAASGRRRAAGPVESDGGHQGDDPHLRSIAEMSGHAIRARDGDLGRLDDFLLRGRSWTIRYMVVNLHRWWPGRQVLVPTGWVTRIEWSERVVRVDVSRAAVRGAAPYWPGPLRHEL